MFGLFKRQTRPQIASAADLCAFLGRQAAFISQKCTVEYCRARAGLQWSKLFRERPFIEAMDICRWEAFAAVLSDVAVLAEARLRPALLSRYPAVDAGLLVDVLTAMVRDRLTYHPCPPHRSDGWLDAVEAARLALARAQMAAPKLAKEIARGAVPRVFETLPIHPSLRGHDHELVQNNLRFQMCRTAEDLDRELDLDAVLDDIVGRPDGSA